MSKLLLVFFMLLASTIASSPPRCEGRRDIVFLLDQSGSVGVSHFRVMLNTVAKIVNRFYIGRYNTQIGVDLFSTNVKTVIKLNDYNNRYRLMRAIRNIKYEGGWTNTHRGLDHLRYYSFSRSYGRRYGVPKIAIVMTDGKSQNKRRTLQAARRARNSGITIFSVGIGRGIDYDEVRGIASTVNQGRGRKRGVTKLNLNVANFRLLSTTLTQNKIFDMTCDRNG